MSPTQRSKKYLEGQGYRVAIVEKWNQWAKVRQDLYGVADLLAMKPHQPLLAVQVTTNDHLAERINKHPATVRDWRSTGNRFEFHGWAKQGARGKRKLWQITVRES